jgi:hypothetical protein
MLAQEPRRDGVAAVDEALANKLATPLNAPSSPSMIVLQRNLVNLFSFLMGRAFNPTPGIMAVVK